MKWWAYFWFGHSRPPAYRPAVALHGIVPGDTRVIVGDLLGDEDAPTGMFAQLARATA